jgi:hypothetical protein
MATLDGIMQQAADTRREIEGYHVRYGTWINGIIDDFTTALAALDECIAGIDRGIAAGQAPSQDQLDELSETLGIAEASARNSASPAQARAILDSMNARIQGYTKPQGTGRPNGPAVAPPVDWMAGGWRPTKKISARKTRTRSKKIKTKTRTRAISKVPVGGYRNRRRMMR